MTKKFLTTKERILLYLLNYASKSLDDYISPKDITQDGIGEAVGIGRNNVPREMKYLIKDGFVFSKKARVNGFKNKRTVYGLTSRGIKRATEIKNRIKDVYIHVTDFSGESHYLQLKDLPKKFGIDMISAALFVNRDRTLDLMDLIGRGTSNVHMIDVDMKIRSFYGRREELARIKRWFRSEKKVLVVTGISGSGKSTLVNKFVKDYLKNRNLIWIEVGEWLSATDIVLRLAHFLSKVGKPKLEKYLKSAWMGFEKDMRWENVYAILKKDLKNEVLIFDNLEDAKDEIRQLITRLVSMVDNLREYRLILIGTDVSHIIPASKMVFMEDLPLGELNPSEAIEFLTDSGVDSVTARKIIKNYGATPLVLELVAKNGSHKILRRYLVENVISNLSSEERKALELASVFRYTVSPNFLLLNDVDYITIYKLINKNLLKETNDEMLLLQKMVKEFIYKHMPPSKRKDYHRFAARYLEEEGYSLKAVYHHIKAGDIPIANRLLVENYRRYLFKGKIEEIRQLTFEILNTYDLSVSDHEWLLYGILGDTYELTGEYEMAIENFQKAADLARHRDLDFYAEAIVKLANLYARRGEYQKAFRELEKSMQHIVQIKDLSTISKARYAMGVLSLYLGDLDRAEDEFNEALKIGEKAMDYEVLGLGYQGMGILYRHLKDHSMALESFNRAKNYFEVIGNKRAVAKVLGNMGLVHYDLGTQGGEENINFAETYFSRALVMFQEIGDKWNTLLSKRNLAGVYQYRNKFEEALSYLDEAHKGFEDIGGLDILPSIYAQYGALYTDKGEAEKAKEYFDKAISLSMEIGNEYRAIKYSKSALQCLSKFENIDVKEYEEIAKGERKVVAVVPVKK